MAALTGAVPRLRAGRSRERRLVYAECIELLAELDRLNVTPLPVRELKALAREASWHLRSLAGLAATVKENSVAQHEAWARASLREFARCAGLDQAPASTPAAPGGARRGSSRARDGR